MSLQTGLNSSNGLSRVLKEDGMHTQLAGSRDVHLVIVEENHLCWLHAQALTGQFKNAPIRLGNALLVGVNDQVGRLIKMIAFLLSPPGSHKAVAEHSRVIARTQAAEIGSQLNIEFTQVLFP